MQKRSDILLDFTDHAWRGRSPKESDDTQILIDVWPTDAFPISKQLPLLSLLRQGV